mgnify:CR=1 FL=1
MSKAIAYGLTRSKPLGRWVGLGPYCAMFPSTFAFEIIDRFSKPGNVVPDPFAGRATSIVYMQQLLYNDTA